MCVHPSAPYDARAVANLLLDLADVRQLQLTQVSLLKLLYFAHGWYLAKTETPLIKQDFEAWQYGPVIKVIRDEFKSFGKNPITSRARRLDLFTSKRGIVAPELRSEDINLVEMVLDAYHRFDAWQLSEMTHEAGSPWDRIWNSSEPTGRLALRIRNEDIQRHFLTVPQRFHLS